MSGGESQGMRWGMVAVIALLAVALLAFARAPAVAAEIFAAAVVLGVILLVVRAGRRVRPNRDEALARENAELKERLAEMEERLANVETISRFEMKLAAKERTDS